MTGATGRGRAARLLIAIVLAISAGTWLAAPAFAAVSITVNKTEGLNPKGETVKVEGAGFKPGIQLYLVTCNPAIPSGGACDLANSPVLSTSSRTGRGARAEGGRQVRDRRLLQDGVRDPDQPRRPGG